MSKTAVILFLRVPVKGKVKTRLAKELGDEFTLELYKSFVLDILDVLKETENLFLYFWPPDKKEALKEWLGTEYLFEPQQGQDLGAKMAIAFEHLFEKGYHRVVLLGSDIPEINRNIIEDACRALESSDAVVGPSSDGGYYLIGFAKSVYSEPGFLKRFFSSINWSTPEVLDQTISRIDRALLEKKILPQLDDMDTVKDLDGLASRVKQGKRIGAYTGKIINEYAQ